MSGYTHAATFHNVAYSHLHPLPLPLSGIELIAARTWQAFVHYIYVYTHSNVPIHVGLWHASWWLNFTTVISALISTLYKHKTTPFNFKHIKQPMAGIFLSIYIIGYGLHKLHMIFHFSSLNIVYFNIFWFF